MILLVPAVLALFGLYSGRDGLVWLAVGLFLWLSWDRKRKERRTSMLFAVPGATDIRVPEFGADGASSREPSDGGGRCGGCA